MPVSLRRRRRRRRVGLVPWSSRRHGGMAVSLLQLRLITARVELVSFIGLTTRWEEPIVISSVQIANRCQTSTSFSWISTQHPRHGLSRTDSFLFSFVSIARISYLFLLSGDQCPAASFAYRSNRCSLQTKSLQTTIIP